MIKSKNALCLLIAALSSTGLTQAQKHSTTQKIASHEDVLLDGLPEHILATMEARDSAFSALAATSTDLGASFFVSDLQKWRTGSTVTVAFLGGSTALHKEIADGTKQITDNCNLSFDFGYDSTTGLYRRWSTSDTSYSADIRVSFDQTGFFSLVGRDSITPSIGRPTDGVGGRAYQRSLNLGGFHIQKPDGWIKTVRHEFLHAIAFHHEHQSPQGGCDSQFRWDNDPGYGFATDANGRYVTDSEGRRPGIYTYLSGYPNYWSQGKVDHNLRQRPASSGTAGTFDNASIMLYRFPALFYKTNPSPCAPTGTGENLSAGDIDGLKHLYPTDPTDQLLADNREKRFNTALLTSFTFSRPAAATIQGLAPQLHFLNHLPVGDDEMQPNNGVPVSPEVAAESEVEDDGGLFSARNYFGKSADEIQSAQIFGRKFFNTPRRGKFNIPDAFIYSERFLTSNPYVTEVGFLNDKAVYFLVSKAALERSPRIGQAEVTSLLHKVASGGEWKKQDTEDEDSLFYEYSLKVGEVTVKLFAYRSANEKNLLIYHPLVSPNFGGEFSVANLRIAFSDGEIYDVRADPDSQEMVIKYIDAAVDTELSKLESTTEKTDAIRDLVEEHFFSAPIFESQKQLKKHLKE